MSIILKTEELKFSYPVDENTCREVLHGLNLEIEKGTFTAIIGHNGSGKSTLAKLLCGMLTPTSGKVMCECSGKMLSTDDEKNFFEIRKNFGMVFQNPDNQLVATVVEEDVAFGPENLGIPREEIRRRVKNALALVGMTEYTRHAPHKLSGGQKQRVAIAGIIAMKPEIIIFDESTAMLDPQGRHDIMETIMALRKKGVTVVLITHYMNEAALADKIFVVHDGKIAFSGTPSEVFTNKKMLDSCGLEPPQCAMLTERIKDFLDKDAPCAINTDIAVKVIEDALKKRGIKKEGECENA